MGFILRINSAAKLVKSSCLFRFTTHQIPQILGGIRSLKRPMQNHIKMNKIMKGVIGILALAFLVSCGNDESGPAYEFIDQPLQGKIGGVDFMMKDGKVEEGIFEEDGWFISIYGEDEVPEACEVSSAEKNYLFFNVPLEVGIYKLYFKLSTFEGQLVNLFDIEDEDMQNLASEGAIEILSISETEVTGRMDARFNNQNAVNGNFTVSFCTEEVLID